MLYRTLLRPLLYLLPAEAAHHLVIGLLRISNWVPGLLTVVRFLFARRTYRPVRAMGLTFPNRVGLAAGFDKNAEVFDALGALGFGFVEVGTITGEPQPGNPTPRLFRLPADRALINRMGFNNRGAEATRTWLERRGNRGRPLLGVNIGKSKIVPADRAMDDYEKSARLLSPYADYLVVNVSSPNTPGLRDLQATASLRPILTVVQEAIARSCPERKVPLLVKIAPDLSDEDIALVAELALELNLDGIIATNTTIARSDLQTSPQTVEQIGAGGLSGRPLQSRARHVLRILKERVGDRVTLIAAGGIETPDEVDACVRAGANLVQVYTAMIYEGPSLPGRLVRGSSL